MFLELAGQPTEAVVLEQHLIDDRAARGRVVTGDFFDHPPHLVRGLDSQHRVVDGRAARQRRLVGNLPAEGVVVEGVDRRVLVGLADRLTLAIILEFRPVVNTAGTVLERAVGIDVIRAVRVDHRPQQIGPVDTRSDPPDPRCHRYFV